MDDKYLTWLATEYKRAVLLLPMVLGRAVMLVAACLAAGGVIAFCAGMTGGGREAEPKLRIGYTAQDNMLADMAVSYVQEMESIKILCSLEAVTEPEGMARLEEGSLSALIVLPDDVINEIISGSNAPAVLYLPGKEENVLTDGGLDAIGSMLFEELASAGAGMLGTAQAQIYASYLILQELGNTNADDVLLQSVCDDINKFNLAAVASREDLFKTKRLSITENDTYVIYFGSAFLTIYVMLACLFLGDFGIRGDLWQRIADRRLGVGYAAQLFSRCLAGGVLMLAVTLLPVASYALLACVLPQLRAVLQLKMTLAGTAGLLLVAAFMGVYGMMLCQMAGRRRTIAVAVGIPAFLQAYVSGCLIPSVLLPEAVAKAGKLVPAAFVKSCFTAFLTGEAGGLWQAASGLAVWCIVMFLCTAPHMEISCWRSMRGARRIGKDTFPIRFAVSISMRRPVQECRQYFINIPPGRRAGSPPIPSVAGVLLRRMLHSKSIWIFMSLFAAASVLIMQTESKSRTRIMAAVYDESGEYGTLLENYDGLVSFQIYDDKNQVMDAVLRKNAECGYFLPKGLAEDMKAHRGGGLVTVYQDEDAVAVPIVNEILFERIFRKVSLEWYCDYIGRLGADSVALRDMAARYFEKELMDGTTFKFEIKRTGSAPDDVSAEKKTLYPLRALSAAVIALCALQGVAQAASDIKKRRFYKRNRAVMAALTVAFPVLFGILVSAAVLYIS